MINDNTKNSEKVKLLWCLKKNNYKVSYEGNRDISIRVDIEEN